MTRRLPIALLLLAACGPVEVGKLTVVLGRGSVDPFTDPGDAVALARPVAALRLSWNAPLVRWTDDAGVVTVPLSAGPSLALDLPAPAARARLTVEGLLTASEDVWSLGRSAQIDPPAGPTPTRVKVLLGRADGWTSVADQAARRGALAVRCGSGALVLGGGAPAADGGLVPAEPGALLYDGFEPALAPLTVSARLDGIGLALPSGAVLHGLGRTADGVPSGELFLTAASGETRAVALSGATLEARSEAAAVLLRDGAVVILGGLGVAGPLTSVLKLTLDEAAAQATVNALPPWSAGRARAGAVQLATGELVVLGGVGAGEVAFDDGLSIDLTQASPGWRQASNRMTVGRRSPQVIRLEDDSVLAWGGGQASGDVFSLLASTDGAFVKLALGALAVPEGARLLRVGRSVLFAGGEPGAAAPFAARFVAAVQTPTLGQQYAGSWLAVSPPAEARVQGALVLLDDDSVLAVGGSAQKLERFTPTGSFLDGD
jgi:hypothetical protein